MGVTIDISQYKTCDVLAALYNSAKPQGMGFVHYNPRPMSATEAQSVLDDCGEPVAPHFNIYFDYLAGRVMKVDVSGPELDPRLYDRDNGLGAAEAALRSLEGEAS